MNLTNLFGKQVFAIYEGEIVGTVVEAIYNADFSKIVSLKIFDADEMEFEIKFSNVKAINDCVIIANKSKLKFFLGKPANSPLFKPVIDQDAKHYGKIIDCVINNSGKIEHFLTDTNQKLAPTNLYFRKSFLYYSTQAFKAKNYRPKQKATTPAEIQVNVLQFEKSMPKSDFAPSRLQYNPSSLLGKIAKDTLFGINNEIIIKANQVITEKTIDDASRHNRLNQLFFLAV